MVYTFQDSTFYQNAALNGNGGAVYSDSGVSSTFTRCVFEYNIAGEGGGLHLNASAPVLNYCVVRHNQATRHGGGVSLSEADATFHSGLFVNNTAGQFGGGFYFWASVPTFTGTSDITLNR